MVLSVEFDSFVAEVKERLQSQPVYVAQTPGGSLATAGDPEKSLTISARSSRGVNETMKVLCDAGLDARKGQWISESHGTSEAAPSELFVAAVAYQSSETKPGIWLDVYSAEPTPQEVLLTLFDEFRENGEVPDVAFEEFMRLATPNVVVVSPDQIRYFVEQKSR